MNHSGSDIEARELEARIAEASRKAMVQTLEELTRDRSLSKLIPARWMFQNWILKLERRHYDR